MYSHSDPTAYRAIGAVEREWRRMAILAYRYRTDPRIAAQFGDPHTLFTGVFSRLLSDPLEDLERTVYGKKLKRQK